MTSPLLVAVLATLLFADCALCQTFSYSRGWKSGKRAGLGLAVHPAAASGRPTDDILSEDLPLYRYLLESRGEHHAPYDPWRLSDDPLVHFARRLPHRDAAVGGDQPTDHEER